MKDIRKHISENRNLFDDKEPEIGHIERFEALLNQQQTGGSVSKGIKRKMLIRVTAVAASIAILIGLGIKVYNPQNISSALPIEATGTDDFRATNEFYNEQMETQIAEIMCKLGHTDTDNQAMLTRDIEKIINNNDSFVKEMKENENKELAILYLIKHYKANIEALTSINERLGRYTNC